MKLERKKKTDYINNARFYEELVKYLDLINQSEAEGKEKPRVSRYIGEAIHELCTRMSHRPNFNGYTQQWKEEMVSDAIINCLASVENFNPSFEPRNPFGFYSRIAWNAFLRRIKEEKKEQYLKHKNLEYISIYDDTGYIGNVMRNNEAHDYIISSFEEKKGKDDGKD